MTPDQQRAEYAVKGKEAEAKAAKATDADARDTWLKIASNYRRLAEFRGYPGY